MRNASKINQSTKLKQRCISILSYIAINLLQCDIKNQIVASCIDFKIQIQILGEVRTIDFKINSKFVNFDFEWAFVLHPWIDIITIRTGHLHWPPTEYVFVVLYLSQHQLSDL
jgi:hypothetical protein